MRRLLLVFLMLLMPLQSVWSAAASACMHEQAMAGQRHFGHHEAHHADEAAPASASADADAQAGDRGQAGSLDTDHHHALNLHPVPHMPLLAMPVAGAGLDRPAPPDPYPSALIASLERPPKATADSIRQGF